MGANNVLTRDRTEQYFMNRKGLQKPYEQAVEIATQNSCSKIGLFFPGEWEYPIMVLLRQQSAQPIRIKDVLVKKISRKYSLASDFIPCAIISSEDLSEGNEIVIDSEGIEIIMIDQHSYRFNWYSEPISVWILK
jgi:hypothetical protein